MLIRPHGRSVGCSLPCYLIYQNFWIHKKWWFCVNWITSKNAFLSFAHKKVSYEKQMTPKYTFIFSPFFLHFQINSVGNIIYWRTQQLLYHIVFEYIEDAEWWFPTCFHRVCVCFFFTRRWKCLKYLILKLFRSGKIPNIFSLHSPWLQEHTYIYTYDW